MAPETTPTKLEGHPFKRIETNLGSVRLYDALEGEDYGYALRADGRKVRVAVQIDRDRLTNEDRATLDATSTLSAPHICCPERRDTTEREIRHVMTGEPGEWGVVLDPQGHTALRLVADEHG